jgi:hypothetical protein
VCGTRYGQKFREPLYQGQKDDLSPIHGAECSRAACLGVGRQGRSPRVPSRVLQP